MLRHYCSLIVPCSCLFREWCGKANEFMLNREKGSDGERSQKTCEVGVSGDYTFVVGEHVVIILPAIGGMKTQMVN